MSNKTNQTHHVLRSAGRWVGLMVSLAAVMVAAGLLLPEAYAPAAPSLVITGVAAVLGAITLAAYARRKQAEAVARPVRVPANGQPRPEQARRDE
jgi:uncharacterized membrane protein YoaK (UPF0700 family)